MIKKEDIKVGLRFYIIRNDYFFCDDYIDRPFLFSIDRYDGYAWRCVSANTRSKFFTNFDTESIMEFGIKYGTTTMVEENSIEGKAE